MMKSYEIRKINGEDIFIKEIAPNFWLVNDVFVYASPEYVLDDAMIIYLRTLRNHPILPYAGAENECVATFAFNEMCGGFDAGQLYLSELKDSHLAELARCAYDEYREWSGI